MKIYRSMIVPFCVALCAAIFAHNAIDLIGDYALAHDTFDDVAHGSRCIFGGVALGFAIAVLWVALRGAVREARGSEAAFCNALRGLAPADVRLFFIAIVVTTFAALVAMQGLDNVSAGVDTDDASSLFGGSLLLGCACTFVSGFVAAFVTRVLFRRIVFIRATIVAVARAFFISPSGGEAAAIAVCLPSERIVALGAGLRRVCAGRAPPALPAAS